MPAPSPRNAYRATPAGAGFSPAKAAGQTKQSNAPSVEGGEQVEGAGATAEGRMTAEAGSSGARRALLLLGLAAVVALELRRLASVV